MAQPDSLVTYTGTVLNLRTENPVQGAQISYKKLPYESEMGDLKTDANGQFTVYFRAQEQYSFSIEGEGFIKVTGEVGTGKTGPGTDIYSKKNALFHNSINKALKKDAGAEI